MAYGGRGRGGGRHRGYRSAPRLLQRSSGARSLPRLCAESCRGGGGVCERPTHRVRAASWCETERPRLLLVLSYGDLNGARMAQRLAHQQQKFNSRMNWMNQNTAAGTDGRDDGNPTVYGHRVNIQVPRVAQVQLADAKADAKAQDILFNTDLDDPMDVKKSFEEIDELALLEKQESGLVSSMTNVLNVSYTRASDIIGNDAAIFDTSNTAWHICAGILYSHRRF